MIFAKKEKVIILTHALYCWLLPATNIPMLLVTVFLIQGHISLNNLLKYWPIRIEKRAA